MKMTISVPDDLWRAVADDDESPSAVVQEGLGLLKADRARRAEPFAGDEELMRRASKGGDLGDGRSLEAHVEEARHMRTNGLVIAVDAALTLTWQQLDAARDPAAVRRELIGWMGADLDAELLPQEFYERLMQLIYEYDGDNAVTELAAGGVRLNSVMVESLVQGIVQTRAAVLAGAAADPEEAD